MTSTEPNRRKRVRSKAEFVRLLWHSPEADYVEQPPDAKQYIVTERNKTNIVIVPWIGHRALTKLPNWIWWPCYIAERSDVVALVNNSDFDVQSLSLDELVDIRNRYYQDLKDSPYQKPFALPHNL